MSMTSMLGKMILAGLIAKGAKKVMGGGSSGGGGASDLLGGLLRGKQSSGSGLGGLLGGLTGGSTAQKSGGGLSEILGSLAGGKTTTQNGGIGDILGAFLGNGNQTEQLQPTSRQNQQAEVLLTAMLNAVKSDGDIDKAEQDRIVKHMGQVSDEEAQFIQHIMTSRLDVDAFIRSVPKGMEQQVYLMSLTSIDLDSKPEAQYLHKLAQGLGISQQDCNQIHAHVGAPQLYS